MGAIISAILLLIIGTTMYLISSAKLIHQGFQALVERLGKYHRTLKPGLHFIVPFLDTIVWEESMREQVLDIHPQEVITKDIFSIKVDAVVYWRIMDVKRAYYEIEDLQVAIENLVLTTLRSKIGGMDLRDSLSNRQDINKALLNELDDATVNWGVKVMRVEIQEIKPVQAVLDSLQKERAAEIQKKASINEAEGVAHYIKLVSDALKESEIDGKEALSFLLAQRYVDANTKLSESPNSKILFMNPGALNKAISELMKKDDDKNTSV
ncbi:SPFH domain-containing protein [Aerosakkonemataceae cyanobacterium BLCC-F50]|uniref:SPFH domain-containing protein n=1 Tax=Floridaenema flaviceps BLCC-F50 TaxID=3153642 RepID=A0ABV4XME6_9CYAN